MDLYISGQKGDHVIQLTLFKRAFFTGENARMLAEAVFGNALKRRTNQSLLIHWLFIGTISHVELSWH